MIFDKSLKRAKELARKDPEKYRKKIQFYQNNPCWYIRYWVAGVPHEEKCPQQYQTARGAEQYYKIVVGRNITGEHVVPVTRKTTISEMADFFISYRQSKSVRQNRAGGFSSAKTVCGHIKKAIGSYTLDMCRENPAILQKYIDSLPETHPEWSPKYRWNICKELRAIFSAWIKKKLLMMPNPMNAVEDPEPETRVMQYVPSHDEYERIISTGIVENVRPDVLRLIGAARYTGFRIGEILLWQCEDCVLNPDDGGLPFIWVVTFKQRRRVRVPRPIRAELIPILKEQIQGRIEGPVWPWTNPPYKHLRIYQWSEFNGRNGFPERQKFRGTLMQVAGVNIRPFHDFRKTVKLELKRNLSDSNLAREYQGHKSDSMDKYYTWFQREDMEKAVENSYRDHDRGQG